jgi:signal peptide peptidase SppA
MPTQLPRISARIFGQPLLVTPEAAQQVADFLCQTNRVEFGFDIEADHLTADQVESRTGFVGTHRRQDGAFSLTRRENGVGIIKIHDKLINRGSWIGASSGLTSYEGIEAQIDAALKDDEVHSIILDINSPGGEAPGMSALALRIRQANEVKPVVAVVNAVAASAAYGIASAASEIVVSDTAVLGSIGVVFVHADRGSQMEKQGVKATVIHAGAHKVDGHPFGPLTESAKANLQDMINAHYKAFINTVAAGRGDRFTAQDAMATEAKTYLGQEAIEIGLADRMASFDQILSELQTNAPSGISQEITTMAGTTSGTGAKGDGKIYTQAEMDAAITNAKAEGLSDATTRIGAILDSDEGKANPALAAYFAFKTQMDTQGAKAALAAAGPATPPNNATPNTIPTPEQRAHDYPEMGSNDPTPTTHAPSQNYGWGDVVAEHNKNH